MHKPILDATCGGRMMWFDKNNPLCLYIDKRKVESMKCCDGRTFSVDPDLVTDFTDLPFEDDTFHLVVFDPPHLLYAGETSYMAIKYGKLSKGWEEVIRAGFQECMRVLKPYGTLIFKWSGIQISTRKVIEAIGQEPLFGHNSGQRMKTHWMTFMKAGDPHER